MTDLTADECSELWKKFENKIKNEWEEKYEPIARHNFLGLSNIQNRKGEVVKAIWNDIENVFKAKAKSTDIIPKEQYFYSLVKAGISTGSHSETIETLIYYLGYDSIKSFTEEFRSQKNIILDTIKNNDTAIHNNSLAIDKPNIPLLNNLQVKWILFLIILVVFGGLSLFSYYWYNTRYFSKSEQAYFKNLIDSAGIKELSLYESSDTSRLKELDTFFTKRGQAKATIFGEMDKTLRENRKLRTLQSHRRIIDWQFLKKSKEEVYIQTQEKWKVVWYNPITDKDISKYDTTNIQLYILIPEDNKWKIDLNDYNGKKRNLK